MYSAYRVRAVQVETDSHLSGRIKITIRIKITKIPGHQS